MTDRRGMLWHVLGAVLFVPLWLTILTCRLLNLELPDPEGVNLRGIMLVLCAVQFLALGYVVILWA